MNQSELIDLDEYFPAHPLFMARKFAGMMCE